MTSDDVEKERRALQVAVQNVVREFESDGMVSGCVITYEVKRTDGGTHLAHRTFNHEGDPLPSWTAEGYLRDHLRAQGMRAVNGLIAPEEDLDEEEEDEED